MSGAVVEFSNGKKVHYSNVFSGGFSNKGGKPHIVLTLIDQTKEALEDAISIMIVDDSYLAEHYSLFGIEYNMDGKRINNE